MSALIQNIDTRLPVKRMSYFGALGNGSYINDTAFADAKAWMQSQAHQARVVFDKPGIYCYTQDPNWAMARGEVLAYGEVRLRYGGTGDAVALDAGSGSQNLYNFTFGDPANPFIIEVESTGLRGCFVRGLHHSQVAVDVRSAGAGVPAMEVDFAVCTDLHFKASVNQDGGWYKGLAPAIGLKLTQRNAGELTSYCNVWRPIIEGVGTGMDLDFAAGTQVYGGTVEACTSGGILETANAWRNSFYGVDMESNSNWDIDTSAAYSSYLNCDTNLQAILNGNRCMVRGGKHQSINVQGGARNELLNLAVNRNGGFTFTDNGTATVKEDIYDMTNGVYIGSSPIFTIANGSGSTTYTNTSYPRGVIVSAQGGTLTTVTKTRGGVTITVANGAAAGEWIAMPGDQITVNWSAAPSVYGTPV
jgi:hypothetical protein